MSGGAFFAEAEERMTELADPQLKYTAAADLFRQAAREYLNGNNQQRAGDSYRKIADCMLHISKLDEAVNAAVEAGKCYAKSDRTRDQFIEAYRVAARAAHDSGNGSLLIKVLLDGALQFEKANLLVESLEFHREAVAEFQRQGKTQDQIRQEGIVGERLVSLKMWEEAAKHYEGLFENWTKVGATESALDHGLYAALCHLARPETLWARKMNEKCAKENKLWQESGQAKLLKVLLVVLIQKHYGEIEGVGKKYSEEYHTPPVFTEIFKGIAAAFADRVSR